MAGRYPIPLGEARIEFTEKNSIFIGAAGPAASLDDATEFIARVKARHPDASHNVWAYLVGYGPRAVYACHNDGEPGGTAGPPALAALQGSGLGDVVVVVTRYFGGVKLGAGGLARAYGRAAREAVAALPRGERVDRIQIEVTVEYHHHDAVQRLLPPFEAEIESINYGVAVQWRLSVPCDRLDALLAELREITSDRASVRRLESAAGPTHPSPATSHVE